MSSKEKPDKIMDLLIKGIRDKVYPGAVLLIALKRKIIFSQGVGRLSLTQPTISLTQDTIFDLASLTKPLATSMAIMKCVEDGKIDLDQPIGRILSTSLPSDKADLTTRQILTHSAGFADWKPFYLKLIKSAPEKRKKLLRKWIMEEPLEYKLGTKDLYSDLGFMILEWIIEECTGTLFHEFLNRSFYSPLLMKNTFFSGTDLIQVDKDNIAATENCPWRKTIMQGTVHDENAYALGGYSGHAGLFGTAGDIYTLADLLMAHYLGKRTDYLSPETVKTFFTKQNIVKGSTRALGWDTPSPQDSSSGTHFSKKTVGHLGFTGTSLWMDLEKDVIVIFLSNRVHPTRKNEKIRAFRPILHDLIMEEVVI